VFQFRTFFIGDRKNLDWERKIGAIFMKLFLLYFWWFKIPQFKLAKLKALLELQKKRKGFHIYKSRCKKKIADN
jgi:hypothetical protein